MLPFSNPSAACSRHCFKSRGSLMAPTIRRFGLQWPSARMGQDRVNRAVQCSGARRLTPRHGDPRIHQQFHNEQTFERCLGIIGSTEGTRPLFTASSAIAAPSVSHPRAQAPRPDPYSSTVLPCGPQITAQTHWIAMVARILFQRRFF